MAHLIELEFKGNRKDFFLWEEEAPPAARAGVIVDADRGEDLGFVHAVGELAAKRNAGVSHGYGEGSPPRQAKRLATPEDVQRYHELRDQDGDARRRAMERVKANQLVMKVSDAEWQWDRKKLTFYFTAERRVDFRNLVRELAAMFRTRIELKQIGVRDEAKRLDGIGRCGRQYCSSSWLPELRPVNLGVAKDQRLSLNPTQISGACGRLMCCLRYEHEFYVQQRKRFPKEGRLVRASRGEEKVLSNDIFRERVTLRGSDGEVRIVPLEELRREIEETGSPFVSAISSAAASGSTAAPSAASARPAPSADAEESDGGGDDDVDQPLGTDGDEDTVDDGGGGEPEAAGARGATPGAEAAAESARGEAAEVDGEARRPVRRRGRRGGRRNRSGGGGGSRTTEGGERSP